MTYRRGRKIHNMDHLAAEVAEYKALKAEVDAKIERLKVLGDLIRTDAPEGPWLLTVDGTVEYELVVKSWRKVNLYRLRKHADVYTEVTEPKETRELHTLKDA